MFKKILKTIQVITAIVLVAGLTLTIAAILLLADGCQPATGPILPAMEEEEAPSSASLGVVLGASSLNQIPSSWVMASAYGERTSTNLTNLIATLGTRKCRVILDGGDWTIYTNVTFPTNVTLEIVEGTRLFITSGVQVVINGPFAADAYEVFTGNGTATGTARFAYRYVEWGSITQFNIGVGRLDNAIQSNISFQMVAATTGRFDNMVANNSTISTQLLMQGTGSTAKFYRAETYFPGPNAGYYRISPRNETVWFSTNMSEAQIRAKVAEYNYAFLPGGHALEFRFSNGVYTFTNGGLSVYAPYGQGSLYWTGYTGDTTIASNKQVTLDFTASPNGDGLGLSVCGGQAFARYLRVKANSTDLDSYAIASDRLVGWAWISACHLECNSTNEGTGAGYFTYAGRCTLEKNYFTKGRVGAYAVDGAHLFMDKTNVVNPSYPPVVGISSRASLVAGNSTNHLLGCVDTNSSVTWGGIIVMGEDGFKSVAE